MKKSSRVPMKPSGSFLGLVGPVAAPPPPDDPTPAPTPAAEESLVAPPAELPAVVPLSPLDRASQETVSNLEASRLIVLTDPRSPHADRIRYLRMHLRSLAKSGGLRTIVVTSAQPKDGKSTISSNLATSLAEHGKRRVLLVEADLHQPSLAQGLMIPQRPGLSECLEAGADPFEMLIRLEPLEIFLLPAGKPRDHSPSDLIQSEACGRLIEKLKAHFDWIVIDTPPVEALSDSIAISRHADGVLFVVRADETPRRSVSHAIDQIGRSRVLGVVLNAAEGLGNLYSKYGRYYGERR